MRVLADLLGVGLVDVGGAAGRVDAGVEGEDLDAGLHRLGEDGLERVLVVADDADRGHFLRDELVDDRDLGLGRRLVGGAQDGLEASAPRCRP